jgi:hypothetical protein
MHERALDATARRLRIASVVAIVLLLAVRTFAQDSQDDHPGAAAIRRWGVSIWGLSYHPNRQINYNENNWGVGLRYSARPHWKWLGQNPENRTFVEGDALRNSHGRLVLPVSGGVEYNVGHMGHACGLFFVAAITVAYYQKPADVPSDIRLGPVTGLTIGCGRIRTNLVAVPSASKTVIAAFVGSITIGL